jgi:hypothetical protein
MRKADYQTLARILKAQARADVSRLNDMNIAATQAGNARAVKAIAHECAKKLNVDPVEFLKACGID